MSDENYRIKIYNAHGIKHAELEKRIFPFFWVLIEQVYVSDTCNSLTVYKWICKYDIPQKRVRDKTIKFETSALLKELQDIYI